VGGSQTRGEEAYIKEAVCPGGADRPAARQTVGSQFGFRKNLDQATFLRRERSVASSTGFLLTKSIADFGSMGSMGQWVNSVP